MFILPIRSVVVALSIIVVATACEASPQSTPPPSATPSISAAEAPPTRDRALDVPELPAPEAGRTTLATVSARNGGTTVATVEVGPGGLWISSDCTGGLMTIVIDPGVRLPIQCITTGVTPSGNRIGYSTRKQLSIRVEAPASVRWNMRVEFEK